MTIWLTAVVLVAAVDAGTDAGVCGDAGTGEQVRCAPGRATELLEAGQTVQHEKGEGGTAEAIAQYQAALEADPACATALWEMGWAYQQQGDWDAAIAAWERLRKLAPDYPRLDREFPIALRRRDQHASLAALPDPGVLRPPAKKPAPGESIAIVAVGDVHMGRGWPEERATLPPDGGTDLLESVSELLHQGDVTFGNLETVLADSGDSEKCGPRSTKCFAFRVPTAFAENPKRAGFTVMSIANNHSGDFGPEGRVSTMAALDGAGVLHSGPVGDIARWTVKGRKLALVAFSTGNDVYRIQEIDIGRRLIAQLARENDLVIVSFHGGAEGDAAQHVKKGREKFYGEDRGDVRGFAHAMIDAGAALVLGHGPHVLRGGELYRGRLVLYSMGNFSSWETFGLGGAKGISGIFKVTLAPNGVPLSIEMTPVFLEEPGRPRVDPEKRGIASFRKLSKVDFGAALLDEDGVWTRPGAPPAGAR